MVHRSVRGKGWVLFNSGFNFLYVKAVLYRGNFFRNVGNKRGKNIIKNFQFGNNKKSENTFLFKSIKKGKIMQIKINTDHNINGQEHMIGKFTDIIKNALNRLSDHITSLEIHLSEQNGHKTGHNNKKCVMEARLEGRKPIAVINNADTLEQAVNGCIDKLVSTIDKILGRLRGHRNDGAGSFSPSTEIPGFEQYEY